MPLLRLSQVCPVPFAAGFSAFLLSLLLMPSGTREVTAAMYPTAFCPQVVPAMTDYAAPAAKNLLYGRISAFRPRRAGVILFPRVLMFSLNFVI